MPLVRYIKRSNIGERLSALYRANGYEMPSQALIVVREMVEKGLLELNPYVDGNNSYETAEKYRQKEEQNAKNTILRHLKYDDASKLSVTWAYCYAEFFNCPVSYLFGETDIINNLGLNNRSLELLKNMNKRKDVMPIADEMLNTLNAVFSDTDKATDFIMAVGDMLGTVHYTASGADIPDYGNDVDPAFVRVVQERRLQMAVDNIALETDKKQGNSPLFR